MLTFVLRAVWPSIGIERFVFIWLDLVRENAYDERRTTVNNIVGTAWFRCTSPLCPVAVTQVVIALFAGHFHLLRIFEQCNDRTRPSSPSLIIYLEILEITVSPNRLTHTMAATARMGSLSFTSVPMLFLVVLLVAVCCNISHGFVPVPIVVPRDACNRNTDVTTLFSAPPPRQPRRMLKKVCIVTQKATHSNTATRTGGCSKTGSDLLTLCVLCSSLFRGTETKSTAQGQILDAGPAISVGDDRVSTLGQVCLARGWRGLLDRRRRIGNLYPTTRGH